MQVTAGSVSVERSATSNEASTGDVAMASTAATKPTKRHHERLRDEHIDVSLHIARTTLNFWTFTYFQSKATVCARFKPSGAPWSRRMVVGPIVSVTRFASAGMLTGAS